MDDSGTHDGAEVCIVAGYWGGFHAWRHFEKAWQVVLDSEGIDEFHAKDAWPRIPIKGQPGAYLRKGPYENWDDARLLGFVDRLLTVIESVDIVPFACGVLGSEWRNLPPGARRAITGNAEEKLQTPLFLCLRTILIQTSKYCKRDQRMAYTFDEMSETSTQTAMLETFKEVKKNLKALQQGKAPYVGGFEFEDSKASAPLQAADLLAYECARYAKKGRNVKGYVMRKEYPRALTGIQTRQDFWLWDEKRFRNFLTGLIQEGLYRKNNTEESS